VIAILQHVILETRYFNAPQEVILRWLPRDALELAIAWQEQVAEEVLTFDPPPTWTERDEGRTT
jgi:hypothetical protein